MRFPTRVLWLAWLLGVACAGVAQEPKTSWELSKDWRLQSSAKLKEDGAAVSSPRFRPEGWHNVAVPSTVVAALVADKTHPDPFFGKNLRSIPGTTYPIAENFSNLPMSKESPFAVSWWYRLEFAAPAELAGRHSSLQFDGINYRANVWLNGTQIADAKQIVGTWRQFELDVTRALRPGDTNVLAVEVFAPTENDLAMTFVDWNPMPPDRNMGLWKAVRLVAHGAVTLRHPMVATKLDSPENRTALLSVHAELTNRSQQPVKGILQGTIGTIRFEHEVELGAGESREVIISPQQAPQLAVKDPRLWWPAQMGNPELHELRLQFVLDGQVSDSSTTKFGMREVIAEMDAAKKRLLFKINGKPILIRGGGWTSDMMVRHDPRRIEQQVRMAQDMGLNTIRLESKLETPDFFELTDRLGMLVMPGWCCCHHWEEWDQWDAEDHKVAEHSQRDQLMRLRKHPSVFVWLNASDMPPTNPEVEKMYIRVLKETHWPTPYLSSATAKVSKVTGETGVKMNGPYDFVPPVYWLEDPEKYGGAWSFATEISPGGAPPPIESMRQMLPPDKLWPVNDWWLYHAGGGQFKDIKIFTKAQDKRYGPSRSAEEFTTKSQMMAYEGLRAMFEAFSRNKYNSTGVIQWMMNDAWPSIIWHQFDVYLRANGGYYGTKKACQPLHAMYSYNDRSVWLISSQYTAAPGLKVTARVFDFDMNQKHVQEATLDAPPDSTQKVFTLPSPQGVSGTYFVHLAVTDGSGKQVSSNLYWLSTKPDTLDWKKSTWYYTPTSSYADFTALNRLPKVQLRTTSQTERQGEQLHTRVVLENTGKTVAFFIRLQLMKGAGEELLPVYWEDNYLSLLPGEKREVVATVDAQDAGTAEPRVVVTGWNVNP